MIDKVFVLNLPHRTDRKWFQMGHLVTIGVPPDLIEFYPARYWKDYKSPETACRAAMRNGFPAFNQRFSQTRSLIVYHWNWCSVLRCILDENITALIMLDNQVLQIQFDILLNNLGIVAYDQPLDIVQCGWRRLNQRKYKSSEIITGMIAKGTRGTGDFATVLKPEGAKLLFKAIHDEGKHSEGLFLDWVEKPPKKEGLYHFIESQTRFVPIDWGRDANWGKP